MPWKPHENRDKRDFKDKKLNLYNKSNGQLYDLNMLIKSSDIKMGTRLILM